MVVPLTQSEVRPCVYLPCGLWDGCRTAVSGLPPRKRSLARKNRCGSPGFRRLILIRFQDEPNSGRFFGMARPRRIDPLVVKRAQLTAAVTTSVQSLRQCQAVLAAGVVRGHPRTNRRRSGRWPCDRAASPGRLPQAPVGAAHPARNWGGRRKSSSPKRKKSRS